MTTRKRKIHFMHWTDIFTGLVQTRCGIRVKPEYATKDPREVTCRTCKLILDIPVG